MILSKRVAMVAFAITVLVLGFQVAGLAGTIELSLPDTCAAPGDTLWLPVYTTDVTDSGVWGYNLTFHFDTSFVEVDSVTSDETISEAWGGTALIWHLAAGSDSLRIADAGIQQLSGEGILVRIGLKILETSPTDSSTMLSIPNAVLRDDPDKPPTVTYPGWLTVPCTAGSRYRDEGEKALEINWLDPARIRWHLDSEEVRAGDLRIYDSMGRLVAEVEPAASSAGATFIWNGTTGWGRKAAAGVYFYRVASGRRFWHGKVGILR
jgi:hypothetical protein